MSTYIYGHWRGLPAREEIATGVREAYMSDDRHENGRWQALGMGYCTEFKAWPDQLSLVHRGDDWGQRHSA